MAEEEVHQSLLWSGGTMKREQGSAVSIWRKYTLFFVNFAIFLISATVIGLMVWILVVKEKEVKNAYDFFLDPSCILCLAGSLAFAASFFGWFGSLRESITALTVYKWILTILFLAEIVFVVLIFVIVYVPDSRQQLKIYPENALKEAIVKYRDDSDMQDLIDGIQQELECCGTSNDEEGYKDWAKNPYFNCTTELESIGNFEFCSVPFSCCKNQDEGLINLQCGRGMQRSDTDPATLATTINARGCFFAISTILQNNVLVVGGVLIGIFIPQIFITALATKLIDQIKIQLAKLKRSIQQEEIAKRMNQRH